MRLGSAAQAANGPRRRALLASSGSGASQEQIEISPEPLSNAVGPFYPRLQEASSLLPLQRQALVLRFLQVARRHGAFTREIQQREL